MSITKLLEHRSLIKRKKPLFLAQDSHKKKRIRKRWVKPRGLHSKIRLGKMGYRVKVTPGYKSPKLVRGTVFGMSPVIVSSLKDFDGLDPVKDGVIISSKVGIKFKLVLLQKAKDFNLTVLNIKMDKFIKKVEGNIKIRKEKKTNKSKEGKKKEVKEKEQKEIKKKEQKEEKEEKENKKKEVKEKESEQNEIEEQEKKEKKELDKILTKKQ